MKPQTSTFLDNEKNMATPMWPQNFQHIRAKGIIGCLSGLLSTHKWFICPISSHYKKIHVCFAVTETRMLVTSYLAGDVLFGRDDLVHVSSQSGIQRSSLDLTGFRQCIILTGGLRQHLSVHGIRNLEGESRLEPFGLDSFGSLCRKILTSIQFLCFCCIFPFRRGLITFLSSGWRVSITRLARICSHTGCSMSFFSFKWF